MPEIRPFTALTFANRSALDQLTAPPYDIITGRDRDRLEALHPHNVVRLILEARDGTSYAGPAWYLRSWLEQGVIVRDGGEGLYLYRSDYRVEGRKHATAGIIAALRLEELRRGSIHPHEHTMAGPKADRLELMRTTRANLEPLWFVADGEAGPAGRLAEGVEERDPLGDLEDPERVRHRVWRLTDDEAKLAIDSVAASRLIIADGHHRYETAIAYRDERRARDGEGSWDFTLALISDAGGAYAPMLLPIHRIANGLDVAALAEVTRLAPYEGSVEQLAGEVRDAPGRIGVVGRAGRWTIEIPDGIATMALAELLTPLQPSISYVHDLPDLEGAVDGGALGFVMPPAPLRSVIEMALDGTRMPPKTTLFWPKPRSGLLMREIDSLVPAG
ncbi:MAG: DUF1015 family protein [Actinomycetota bacterium]